MQLKICREPQARIFYGVIDDATLTRKWTTLASAVTIPTGNADSERDDGRQGINTKISVSLACICGLIFTVTAGPVGPIPATSILRPYLPSSPHRAYGFEFAKQDLARSALQQAWVDLADRAILEPIPAALPFEFTTGLDLHEPWAAGYVFTVETGRRLHVELLRENGAEHAEFFVDLFRLDGERPEFVTSTPAAPPRGPAPARMQASVDLPSGGEYIVRVQSGLQEHVGSIRLAIRAEPQLWFPVSGHGIGSIQSGFGAARDGGAREHHGVDIFAPRGTPVLAALDARVSRVETTTLGGYVVWLQPLFSNTHLYYAHLDSQTVEQGQYVFMGEAIGTVGNTGNARTTTPHLHFGVYIRNRGGPRDPFPFLKQTSR